MKQQPTSTDKTMTRFTTSTSDTVQEITSENGSTRFTFGNYNEHGTSWRLRLMAEINLAFLLALNELIPTLDLKYVGVAADFSYSTPVRLYIYPLADTNHSPDWCRIIELKVDESYQYGRRGEVEEVHSFFRDIEIDVAGRNNRHLETDAATYLNTLEEATMVAFNLTTLLNIHYGEEAGKRVTEANYESYEQAEKEADAKKEARHDFGKAEIIQYKGVTDTINVKETWVQIFALTSAVQEDGSNWIDKRRVDRVVHDYGLGQYIDETKASVYLSHCAKTDDRVDKAKESGRYVIDTALVGDMADVVESKLS